MAAIIYYLTKQGNIERTDYENSKWEIIMSFRSLTSICTQAVPTVQLGIDKKLYIYIYIQIDLILQEITVFSSFFYSYEFFAVIFPLRFNVMTPQF